MTPTMELRFVERIIKTPYGNKGTEIAKTVRILQQKWVRVEQSWREDTYIEEWIDVPVEKETEMTPPEMTDEQIDNVCDIDTDAVSMLRFAKAIIAARDKQWAEIREADEALMREALEMCEAVLCNYVCRGTHEETVKHNAAIDAVRARLGDL